MRRRAILTGPVSVLLGGVLTRAVQARAPTLPVIGYLGSETPERAASRLEAFREGLADAGFVEGRDVAIAFRWADGRYERLPALAKELAGSGIAVLVSPGGAPVVLAARAATETIPIVFEMGGDPVVLGVVEDLARPRGNLTGVSSLSVEVSNKRLEFMRELFPTTAALAVAVNPTSPTAGSQLAGLQASAASLGLQIHVLEASREDEFETLSTAPRRLGVPGLVFTSDPFFAYRSAQLAMLASRHGLPAITQSRDFPNAGGLLSYGGDFTQTHRQAGIYAGRLLRGEKLRDLPVQLVTKVELFANVGAATRLGVTLPPSILSSADVVIE
ncbi:ABC transporter substrate-binding protein [Methylobacterium mesophilicum SR1.6/6]|uniref:ABC transporter substrate-binding protein n=1 Tax=Methylobacterium mesophilicum SR1.6/6 TaxID=908290 RepID=A0A6B9FTQ4_9HYPH|nr:ABC transporter substrate-binding protein [Methylobacterium mesophilicum]QGY05980.1 ABC transporter substrate-binding protein [Methylobacterium mesophilicum SR1.6/6]